MIYDSGKESLEHLLLSWRRHVGRIDRCGNRLGIGGASSGGTQLSFRMKLLHNSVLLVNMKKMCSSFRKERCYTNALICTSTTESCGNFHCQVLKEKLISPDEVGGGGVVEPRRDCSLTLSWSLSVTSSLSFRPVLCVTPPPTKKVDVRLPGKGNSTPIARGRST